MSRRARSKDPQQAAVATRAEPREGLHELDREVAEPGSGVDTLAKLRARAAAYRWHWAKHRAASFARPQSAIVSEADALLRELVGGYLRDAHSPTESRDSVRESKAVLAGLSDDPEERWRRFCVERVQALPLLRELVTEYRMLRPGIRDLDQWRAIPLRWNEALRTRDWRTLPTLCAWCGVPVVMRQAESREGQWVLPTACCRAHGDLARDRRNRTAKKIRRAQRE